jgi:hypothetical protein
MTGIDGYGHDARQGETELHTDVHRTRLVHFAQFEKLFAPGKQPRFLHRIRLPIVKPRTAQQKAGVEYRRIDDTEISEKIEKDLIEHHNKLIVNMMQEVERVKGIEPSSQAWEARILPLDHTRVPILEPIAATPG